MALGKRPGGLTAMAVLNFVFGGIGAISTLLLFLGLSLIKEGIAKAEASGLKYEGQSLSMAYVAIALGGLSAILLIAAGVGYLRETKTGRMLGNLYALVSLGGTVLVAVTGGGIGAFGVFLCIYPVLTLILINSAFKANLVK